jgi:capsular exopolysaccharide synthesis family protein
MNMIAKKPGPASALRPVSAIVANPREVEFGPGLVMIGSPNDARAEAVRALRTHIMAQHLHEGRRALAICAASAGVGCTFIAANLAVALSQIGVKTLLIEGDMRRPELDRYIRVPRNELGLTQCLASDEVDFGAAIEADVMPNLSLIYAGGASATPQELLAGERFRDLMEFCLREYDITLVDTPPANTCADGRRISTVVGYSAIVTRRDQTFVEDVKVLAAQLEADRAKIVGTILNEG